MDAVARQYAHVGELYLLNSHAPDVPRPHGPEVGTSGQHIAASALGGRWYMRRCLGFTHIPILSVHYQSKLGPINAQIGRPQFRHAA